MLKKEIVMPGRAVAEGRVRLSVRKSVELINAVIVALSERQLSVSEMRTARCMVGSGAGMLVAVWFSPVLAGVLFVVFALCVSMLEKGGAR